MLFRSKFTSDSPMAAGLQEGPLRAALGPSTPARLPGSSHISTTPASSSSGPSSRGPSDTSSQFNKDQRGTARPLAQLQSCPREEGPRGRGLAVRSLENRAGGPMARSEAPSAPLAVAVGTAEPGASMKTTFTIEIKDGRGQASTGRVLLPTGNQRAGRPPHCLPTAGDDCLQPPSSAHRTSAVVRAQGVSKGCTGSDGRHQPGLALPSPHLILTVVLLPIQN